LKGKYLLDKRTEVCIYKAIECFQTSITHDPLNVHSYVEMIECYFTLYFSDYMGYNNALDKINPIVLVISKLNQNIDVVQAIYGGKKMYLDWNFEEAESHFQFALDLNPNCLIARHRYPLLLLITGRFSEALHIFQPIMSIDPLSVLSYKRASRFFYRIERFENAITYLNRILELEPNDYETLTILGSVLAELGNYDEALVVLLKSMNIQYNLETLSMIGYVNALKKEKNNALKIIKQIESKTTGNTQHSIKLARIYTALEEKELAFKFLEKAYCEHDVDLLGLKSDPRWNSINQEPKFSELTLKIGLPVD
jgi:tetratricopeptide (TPR) repeat protein